MREASTEATATTAAGLLDALQDRMRFPVRAIPVEGGSELQAAFESRACRDQQRGIHLFVLLPRSPKLNGRIERSFRTDESR